MHRHVIAGALALFAVAACAKRASTSGGGGPSGTAPTDAVQPLAVIPVHVTYTLRALVPSLDSLFPAQDSLARAACQNAAGLICHQYVYRREPLVLTATGDRVSINTRLQYRARVGLPGARIASCGYAPQPMRRASLLMSTSLYWRRDWRIGARQTAMQATLDDQCRVTALSLDVGSPGTELEFAL